MHRIPGGMSKRSAAGTTLIALGLATTSIGFLATGAASADAGGSKAGPPGNNGTVKVENVVLDNKDTGRPENNPHLPCTFTVEWWNFEQGDYYGDISFALQEPTGAKDHTMSVSGPSHVFIGEDPADGAGAANGRDASVVYTLSFTGDPHPQQGYHVKVTTHNEYSQGADTNYKVFWVGPCEETPTTQPTSSASSSASESTSTSPSESASTPMSSAPTSASTQPSTPESSATVLPTESSATVLPTESSATVLPTESSSVPETSTTPIVLPTSSTAPPKHTGKPSTTPTVLPSQRTASPSAAPTAVDAGLPGDGDGGIPSSLLILLGAAMAVLGLGVGFAPVIARGKHSH